MDKIILRTFEEINNMYGGINIITIHNQTTGDVKVLHKQTGFPKMVRNHYKFSNLFSIWYKEKIIGQYDVRRDELIIAINGREI